MQEDFDLAPVEYAVASGNTVQASEYMAASGTTSTDVARKAMTVKALADMEDSMAESGSDKRGAEYFSAEDKGRTVKALPHSVEASSSDKRGAHLFAATKGEDIINGDAGHRPPFKTIRKPIDQSTPPQDSKVQMVTRRRRPDSTYCTADEVYDNRNEVGLDKTTMRRQLGDDAGDDVYGIQRPDSIYGLANHNETTQDDDDVYGLGVAVRAQSDGVYGNGLSDPSKSGVYATANNRDSVAFTAGTEDDGTYGIHGTYALSSDLKVTKRRPRRDRQHDDEEEEVPDGDVYKLASTPDPSNRMFAEGVTLVQFEDDNEGLYGRKQSIPGENADENEYSNRPISGKAAQPVEALYGLRSRFSCLIDEDEDPMSESTNQSAERWESASEGEVNVRKTTVMRRKKALKFLGITEAEYKAST